MTDRELMQQALELEQLAGRFSEGWHEGIKIDALDIELLLDVAAVLRDRLAQSECNHEDRITMLACVKCGALVGTPPQQEQEPAQEPEQEQKPVAWLWRYNDGDEEATLLDPQYFDHNALGISSTTPLYPPRHSASR